jgi:hypothetical protein
MATASAKPAQNTRFLGEIFHLFADLLHLREWRQVDPIASFLLAAFAAIISQPLVSGRLGNTLVALMTPVR